MRESDVRAILEGLKVVQRRRPWSEQNRNNQRPTRNEQRIEENTAPRPVLTGEDPEGAPEAVYVDIQTHENNPPEDMAADLNIDDNTRPTFPQDDESDSSDEQEFNESEIEDEQSNLQFVSTFFIINENIVCL